MPQNRSRLNPVSQLRDLSQSLRHWTNQVLAETGRQLNRQDHSITAFVFFYLIGYLFFAWTANWTADIWVRLYYIWEKTSVLLACVSLYQWIPKIHQKKVIPILLFALLRWLLEAYALLAQADANSITIVNLLFIAGAIALIASFYLTVRER